MNTKKGGTQCDRDPVDRFRHDVLEHDIIHAIAVIIASIADIVHIVIGVDGCEIERIALQRLAGLRIIFDPGQNITHFYKMSKPILHFFTEWAAVFLHVIGLQGSASAASAVVMLRRTVMLTRRRCRTVMMARRRWRCRTVIVVRLRYYHDRSRSYHDRSRSYYDRSRCCDNRSRCCDNRWWWSHNDCAWRCQQIEGGID